MTTTDPSLSDSVKCPLPQKLNSLDAARILLVDDAPEITALFSIVLQREGATVWVVDDSQSTMNLHQQFHDIGQPLNLIILDWMMPDMSGLDLARFIRAKDDQVKIVFLTAYYDLIHQEQVEEVRGELWAKPIEIKTLVDNVGQVLSRV
ncbi:MAG TPA: response regulator [Abditibacteriaceae bacterium]|jgi:DNA-binding response OmpR family regulator